MEVNCGWFVVQGHKKDIFIELMENFLFNKYHVIKNY